VGIQKLHIPVSQRNGWPVLTLGKQQGNSHYLPLARTRCLVRTASIRRTSPGYNVQKTGSAHAAPMHLCRIPEAKR